MASSWLVTVCIIGASGARESVHCWKLARSQRQCISNLGTQHSVPLRVHTAASRKLNNHQMRVLFCSADARTPFITHIQKTKTSPKLLVIVIWSFRLDVYYRSSEAQLILGHVLRLNTERLITTQWK